jgi:hypothetical protein
MTSVKGSAEQWDSGVLNAGATFDCTFAMTGTFVHYCKIHGVDNRNGTASGMASKIIVTTTPTPSPTPIPPPSIAPLHASGANTKAKVNTTIHPLVAHFSEKGTQAADFTVLIDRGDRSTPTFGKVRRTGNGRFTVTGTHRYLTPGVFQVMAMIQDQSGQEADAMSMGTVTGKVKPAHR